MRAARNRRGGYAMVLLATLLFGLMAMAALVIDLGFARLAQRQLQSAADAAALEGLRGQGSAASTYEDRQAAAEQLVVWTFDDDLNPTNGDGGAFGAGPIVNFSGGQPGLQASPWMTVDVDNATYKPMMQRRASPTGDRQFRVAIQRGGAIAEDYDLFSEGSAVPYLFARGSLVDRERLGNGIRVGGLAIAEARPAVKVWPAVAGLPGIQPVAYSLSDWGASPDGAVSITSDITDGISIGKTIVPDSSASVGSAASGYCAIFDPATMRVVGFGMLGQNSPATGIVATHNASARLSDAWDALAELDAEARNEVLAQNRALQYALTAPVLVRN